MDKELTIQDLEAQADALLAAADEMYLLTSLLYLRVALTKELIQKRIRIWDVMRTATLV